MLPQAGGRHRLTIPTGLNLKPELPEASFASGLLSKAILRMSQYRLPEYTMLCFIDIKHKFRAELAR